MENKSMYEVVMNDFKQVYNFEKKDDEVVGPKIKFPKAVYDRVQAFNTIEAFYNGWTHYGIMQLILGKLKKGRMLATSSNQRSRSVFKTIGRI